MFQCSNVDYRSWKQEHYKFQNTNDIAFVLPSQHKNALHIHVRMDMKDTKQTYNNITPLFRSQSQAKDDIFYKRFYCKENIFIHTVNILGLQVSPIGKP